MTEESICNTEIYPLLSKINSPADLRNLPLESLPQLCAEIRKYLITNLSSNPGHFASSMGAVDIIVALHYVFDTPRDNIVFDVGHQAYAHKILTGRRDAFTSQRTKGGISGFPNPNESEADSFIAGHAGNSISAALGMAVADKSNPERQNCKTVALIGDASISNGLAFEGLNNASNQKNDLLIILNDNEMSIDKNVGALHRYLSQFSTSRRYNKFRFKAYNFLHDRGMINDSRKGRIIRLNNSLKAFISKQQNIFEGLNIRYFGPIDGHDVTRLVKTLREIKDMGGPRLLHLHTTKGKGFEEAEKNPATWHAPGKFDPDTGIRDKEKKKTSNSENITQHPLWQEVFGETLVELSEIDDRVVGITAAMPSGTSVNKLMKTHPEKAYDVGISEGHAVTFAGGMAKSGKRPFVAIYSSFLQRAYDNIIHDVAIQTLPVVFCIDRAGLVGEDGVTHHGLFDLAYLRCIPGLDIAVPSDSETLRNLMYSSLYWDNPLAIRYPRGAVENDYYTTEFKTLEKGKGRLLKSSEGAKIAVLAVGTAVHEAQKALSMIKDGEPAADLYDMIWVKPLDLELLRNILEKYDRIITVEDGTVTGGFGSAVAEAMLQSQNVKPLRIMGIPDRWIDHATVKEQRQEAGIDSVSIYKEIIRKI